MLARDEESGRIATRQNRAPFVVVVVVVVTVVVIVVVVAVEVLVVGVTWRTCG